MTAAGYQRERLQPLGYLAPVAARNGGRAGLAALITIITLGLGLRLAYAVEGRDYQPPDAVVYAQIAENLHENGEFSARGPETPRIHQPASAYSPGLPLLLSGIYGISGGEHQRLARILLALLGAATVWLTYLIGRRLSGTLAGLIGAAAIAIYPALLEYHGLLLTEPLAAFLLSGAVLAFLRAQDEGGAGWWIVSGVALGALSLVRAEYLVVTLALPALALARGWRSSGLRAALVPSLVMLVAALLVLAPWTVRNAVVLERFVPVSTGGGKALYIGTHVEAEGDGEKLRSLLLARHPELRAKLARTGSLSDPDRYLLELLLTREAGRAHPGIDTDTALGKLGRENLGNAIAEQPGDLLAMLAAKAYDTWTEPAREPMKLAPWRALQLGLLAAAVLGLAILGRARRFEALVLGAIPLYITLVAAILISSPRRAIVPLPLLAALAGVGVAWLAALARERRGAGAG